MLPFNSINTTFFLFCHYSRAFCQTISSKSTLFNISYFEWQPRFTIQMKNILPVNPVKLYGQTTQHGNLNNHWSFPGNPTAKSPRTMKAKGQRYWKSHHDRYWPVAWIHRWRNKDGREGRNREEEKENRNEIRSWKPSNQRSTITSLLIRIETREWLSCPGNLRSSWSIDIHRSFLTMGINIDQS